MAGIMPAASKAIVPVIEKIGGALSSLAPEALLLAHTSGSSNGGTGNSSGGSGGMEHGSGGKRKKGTGRRDVFNKKWKELEAKSPWIAQYNNIKLVQTVDERYWYTKDSAGHGEACAKCYEDKGSTLVFMYSVDEYFEPILAKHESMKYPVIKKKDLNTVVKRR